MTERAWPEALAAARRAFTVAEGQWRDEWPKEDGEDGDEAEQLARDALAHLDHGRWDEARVCADEAVSLAEASGRGRIWRNFSLLVEEAAEIGRDRTRG